MLGLPKINPLPPLLVLAISALVRLGCGTLAVCMRLPMLFSYRQCTIYALSLQLIYDLDHALGRLLQRSQLLADEIPPAWLWPWPWLCWLSLWLQTHCRPRLGLAPITKHAIRAVAIRLLALSIHVLAQHLPPARTGLDECRHALFVYRFHRI